MRNVMGVDGWTDTMVSELQGGNLIRYQDRTWLITRLLWAPHRRRDVRMEPWPEGGESIERTFNNWSVYPSRRKP